MAVDDVISDYETQVANGAQLTIQPASGDEWLVTSIVLESRAWQFLPHTDAGPFDVGAWGGSSGSVTDFAAHVSSHQVRFFLTNAEYIRMHNASGSTNGSGYSGIKTKE